MDLDDFEDYDDDASLGGHSIADNSTVWVGVIIFMCLILGYLL